MDNICFIKETNDNLNHFHKSEGVGGNSYTAWRKILLVSDTMSVILSYQVSKFLDLCVVNWGIAEVDKEIDKV